MENLLTSNTFKNQISYLLFALISTEFLWKFSDIEKYRDVWLAQTLSSYIRDTVLGIRCLWESAKTGKNEVISIDHVMNKFISICTLESNQQVTSKQMNELCEFVGISNTINALKNFNQYKRACLKNYVKQLLTEYNDVKEKYRKDIKKLADKLIAHAATTKSIKKSGKLKKEINLNAFQVY